MAEVWCRRVKCSGCKTSWTLRPFGLMPHKHYQLCVVARAASEYVFNQRSTQASVAAEHCYQRITTVARLLPLSADETRTYVDMRLRAAGVKKQPVFDDRALDAVFDAAAGVPRRINGIATGALIVAAARKRRIVSAQDIQDARLDRGRA